MVNWFKGKKRKNNMANASGPPSGKESVSYNRYYAGVEYIGEYGKPYIEITEDGRCYIKMLKNGRLYVCECGRCKVYIGVYDENGRFRFVEYQDYNKHDNAW